jgi:hypothetical protein
MTEHEAHKLERRIARLNISLFGYRRTIDIGKPIGLMVAGNGEKGLSDPRQASLGGKRKNVAGKSKGV